MIIRISLRRKFKDWVLGFVFVFFLFVIFLAQYFIFILFLWLSYVFQFLRFIFCILLLFLRFTTLLLFFLIQFNFLFFHQFIKTLLYPLGLFIFCFIDANDVVAGCYFVKLGLLISHLLHNLFFLFHFNLFLFKFLPFFFFFSLVFQLKFVLKLDLIKNETLSFFTVKLYRNGLVVVEVVLELRVLADEIYV